MAYIFLIKENDGVSFAKNELESFLSHFDNIIAKYEINDFGHEGLALELPHPSQNNLEFLKESIHKYPFDVILYDVENKDFPFGIKKAPNFNNTGVLLMDMDMTSVQIEGIDMIAKELGVFDEVAKITHEAMSGNLEFKDSLRLRVSKLKGGNASCIDRVKAIMHETNGLDTLINKIRDLNWKVGIASGGFTVLIKVLEDKYKLDLVRANQLEIVDGHLTGKVLDPIVDNHAKRDALFEFMNKYQVNKNETIVIGDGANDLLMINEANIGVAYHAKAVVQDKALVVLNHSNLAAIAFILDFLKKHI